MKESSLNSSWKLNPRRFRLFFHAIFCLIGVLVILSGNLYAGDSRTGKLVISGIINEQTHAMAKEVLQVAYKRIGYDVQFDFFPGGRSLDMANDGMTDGDIARINDTQIKFPNLIPVATPVIYFQGVAFTKSVIREIHSWDDLKGLHVGIIRGIRYSTLGTKGLDTFFAEGMTHLFKLLDQDMIQIAIAVLQAGQIEISRNFKGSGIHVIGEDLYSAPLFHYVHKKNQNLVPELNTALKQMKIQGEIQKIVDSKFRALLDNTNNVPLSK